MKINKCESTKTNIYELEIAVEAEEFAAATAEAFRKKSKGMTVPGFRKGKAPRHLIEKLYGKEVFYEEAVNSTYSEATAKAIEEKELSPVCQPEVEIMTVDENGYTLKATVTVKPEITVSDYKGIKAEKTEVNVTDADVDTELSEIARRYARLVTVSDRAAQLEDVAVIDYEGFVDGVAFEGGKGENHNLTLGSGQFIPGFEEQIVGKNTGDEFDVNVTFPEEYHSEELSGKQAVFKVKLNEIKFSELPKIDDEFAKDASEFSTLEEFRDSIKKRLTETRTAKSENDLVNSILEAVVAGMQGEVPEVMYQQELDSIIYDYENRLKQQGLTLEMYLSYSGMDMEAFRKMFYDNAVRNVKTRLCLEKIAQLESIAISDEELDDKAKELSEHYKVEVERVKAMLGDELMKDAVAEKAVEFLKNNAEVTVVAEKTAEKPAPKKKTASKKTAAAKDESEKPAEKKPAAKKPAAKKTAKADKAE